MWVFFVSVAIESYVLAVKTSGKARGRFLVEPFLEIFFPYASLDTKKPSGSYEKVPEKMMSVERATGT